MLTIKKIIVLIVVLTLIWLFDKKFDKGGYYNAQYHWDTFWKSNPDTVVNWK